MAKHMSHGARLFCTKVASGDQPAAQHEITRLMNVTPKNQASELLITHKLMRFSLCRSVQRCSDGCYGREAYKRPNESIGERRYASTFEQPIQKDVGMAKPWLKWTLSQPDDIDFS